MNKKFITPLFLAASAILVGCSSDTIVARPSWQNDNIIEDSSGLKDNKMKAIYDAIKNLGDTNSSVLTKIMYDIAQTQIGTFTELEKFGKITNEEDIKKIIETNDFKNFVNSHSLYKADTKGATRNGSDVSVVDLNETQQLLTSFYKIQQQYNQIVENIYEKLYDEIKGGSYSTTKTKLFQEQYFVDYLIKELYEVNNLSSYTLNTNKVFLPKAENVTYKEYVNGFLNVVKLDSGKPTTTTTGIYDDYISRKILPELYKTYLAETYVKEQRYSSLGRSYARKVNMVTVSASTTYSRIRVKKMLNYFAKTYITGATGTIEYNFENIEKAMIGFVGTNTGDVPYTLLNTGGGFDRLSVSLYSTSTPTATTDFNYVPLTTDEGQKGTGTPTHVFQGTKLAELVSKIEQCCDLTLDTNKNLVYTPKLHLNDDQKKAYDELTSNGAYSIEKGIEIKEREIRQTSYVKYGWYLKNGGLTDLSSTVRDRLFNISTSTQIDNYNRKSSKYTETNDYIQYYGSFSSAEDISKRKAFLTLPITASQEEEDRIVLNESGNDNFYIIEVQEATNTSKLYGTSNQDSYIRLKADQTDPVKSVNTSNEIIREIVKANATSDTYKKNANEYYLMISNIVFYDQSVYDYFKSQFPDLFK